jgi:steroid 5-alpha reductase family enzyme
MSYYLSLLFVVFLYMNAWFLWSLIVKRNDVADIAWGLGFVLLAWLSLQVFGYPSLRGYISACLVSLWGGRLALHIYLRNHDKAEDYRYRAWRKDWGQCFYLRAYVQVYLLQGALLFLIAWPIMIINKHVGPELSLLDYIGISVWLFGFFFESVSDMQLLRFIKNPANKGKIMQSGLWQYSRHPNYFGEVVQWWGIWLIALSVPWGLLTIISPLTISILILFISGIPMLEKKMTENPAFRDYQKRVSVFFPMPKKR